MCAGGDPRRRSPEPPISRLPTPPDPTPRPRLVVGAADRPVRRSARCTTTTARASPPRGRTLTGEGCAHCPACHGAGMVRPPPAWPRPWWAQVARGRPPSAAPPAALDRWPAAPLPRPPTRLPTRCGDRGAQVCRFGDLDAAPLRLPVGEALGIAGYYGSAEYATGWTEPVLCRVPADWTLPVDGARARDTADGHRGRSSTVTSGGKAPRGHYRHTRPTRPAPVCVSVGPRSPAAANPHHLHNYTEKGEGVGEREQKIGKIGGTDSATPFEMVGM